MERNRNGTFKQGHSGGRPKGAKNKANKPLREMLTDFAESRFQQFVDEYDSLPAEKKVRAYADVLTYVLPKLKPTTIESEQLDDWWPVRPRPPIEWVP